MAMNEYLRSTIVDRLVEIKMDTESLSLERSHLEGLLLKQCQVDLNDTKRKTVSYTGCKGRVTATMASSLKVSYPQFLKKIFGTAYPDAVTVETKYKLSASATRMLIGLWKGDYTEMTIAQVVEQLPCGDTVKAVLKKKLKGANFETDRKNLMAIGGLTEKDASDYAYFVSEAAVWENFQQLLNVANDTTSTAETTLKMISGAFVVEETPKITVEAI